MKYLLTLRTAFVLVPTLGPVDTFAEISLGDCADKHSEARLDLS